MVVEGGPGLFAPDETRSYVLTGASGEVDAPRGGRIRLARAAGSLSERDAVHTIA